MGWIAVVVIEPGTPDVDRLDEVVDALRDWQREDAPVQLHPGDLGWYWQFGAPAVAAAVRTWRRDGALVAVGFLDGPDVLRMTVAPEVWRDDELARQVLADVAAASRGVLPAGKASIEIPAGARVGEVLSDAGWRTGEAWSPLRLDLAEPLEPSDLQVEVVARGQQSDFVEVHRSAWRSPRFTDALWTTMTSGRPFADARCLLGRDSAGAAVAGVTVWSAGQGRPGLLEPMGVHAEHRGRGHGVAICRAGAAALRDLGSSSAVVCTPSSLVGAVATYWASGFQPLPERLDRTRDA